jgi:hypothetical protein
MKELLVRGNSFYFGEGRAEGSARLFFVGRGRRGAKNCHLTATQKDVYYAFSFSNTMAA